ncbi:AAA family ATPase [Streptomyces sp. NPDC057293]|uniref:AAA family ATPase n=1 Tax=unclassified Streptomyces TaxID=2593676 RepID=UPI003635A1B1
MTLVGRTAAIGTLDEVLAECFAGVSRTVLIEGPAGCGKSVLVDTVVERAAAAGATVLCAVASPAEQDVPLGVIRQLVHGDPSLALPEDALAAPGVPSRVQDTQSFCAALREAGRAAPVVLCVDDVRFADDASLAHLQYLARHARSARVLVVVTASPHGEAEDSAFTTELMRQPTFRRIRLGRLTEAEVAEAARPRGLSAAAPWLHRVSAGNPLLVRALLEEAETGTADADGRFVPEPGGPFAQSVAACLHRAGPTVTAVARGAALLAGLSTAERIQRLLSLGAPAVQRALVCLHSAGLLDGTRFRHAAVRDAVLDAMPSGARGDLHRDAALLLRHGGSPATAVAGHLLAGAADGGGWQAGPAETEVLRDAAEELIASDDPRQAAQLLEFAHATCPDERQRCALLIRLSQVTWRFSPASAERYVSTLLAALREDRLDVEHIQPLAQVLLTQGRVQEFTELLGRSAAPAPEGDEAGTSPLDVVLDAGAAPGELVLESARLTDATMAPITQALHSLIHCDQPERAVSWSRKLLEEADRRDAPGWSAVFATLHAEALLRTGDLRGARAFAARALDTLPEKTGGTFHYAPTAILIRAHSAMGQYAEASRYADEPVPRRVYATLHGLGLLRARGLHLLAGNQPHAALADFLEVGRLMENWGVDRPAYLPWRTDAAEALLRLGRRQHAERLVVEQLGTRDARRPWVRGVSLRLRALAGGAGKQRIALLSQSVDELQRSGDRVATARATADLGQALQAENLTPAKGSTLVRTAWNLAKECEAGALCKEILPDAPLAAPAQEQTAREPGEVRLETKLSSSEQRVATLAAQGLTNREISAKLYLTVSTVEQHLTRVYRKLQISCRGDLPMDLALGSRQPLER